MDFHCLHCGLKRSEYVRRYRSTSEHGKIIFGDSALHRCSQCGLVQVHPIPQFDQLASYYSADYRNSCKAGADVADARLFPKDNLFYYNRGRSIAGLLAKHLRGENLRILDVGAGYGHVLDALRERFPGSVLTAIEPSQACVQHLNSLDIRVIDQPVERALLELDGEFDLVVLSHVLEHLLDPFKVVAEVRERLAQDGRLYIEVPNIPRKTLNRFADNTWAPRFDEPHITFFSRSILSTLLGLAGWEVEFCETAGPSYKLISSFAFRLPHWRWFIQDVLPPSVFAFLRRLSLTSPMRVQERENDFYRYGGFRIWLRSISSKRNSQSHE